ncbi:MAG TPA: carbohydrate kinase [Mesotoga infera]|uniref:Carbohydrate kinase n=1 Tax=Mesotoga infera TaxID=1236046 RepID=A0A7C1GRV7_9BACT|nr:carbohydrate kinase [Mesotoga infera]
MKISVVGNVNIDLSAFIINSGNSEENRVREIMFSVGGSAANTAIMLNRLRKNVHLQGAVGKDQFGEMAIESLKREGVDTEHLSRLEGRTGFCFSAVSTDGQRHLFTYRGVNEANYSIDESSDFYHFGGIRPDQIERLIKNLRRPRFSYNPGGIVSFERGPQVAEIAAQSEILFVNESEWRYLEKLMTVKPLIIVTLGAEGARIENGPLVDAFEVKVVDTTGAGDAFNAGFLHGYLADRKVSNCLQIGNLLAALVVSRQGASPGFIYNDVQRLARIYNVSL